MKKQSKQAHKEECCATCGSDEQLTVADREGKTELICFSCLMQEMLPDFSGLQDVDKQWLGGMN